jgi:hypothetical protein
MLTFREFMLSEAGARGMLGHGMTPRRHRVAKDFSPTAPLGADIMQKRQHAIDNIATMMRYLYDRYQSKALVTVQGQPCLAETDLENWHEEALQEMINRGVLVELPKQTVNVISLKGDLVGAIPTFEYYSGGKHLHLTTQETLEGYQKSKPQLLQNWYETGRIPAVRQPDGSYLPKYTPINNVKFYTINVQEIGATMQRQKMAVGGLNLLGTVWNGLFDRGHGQRLRQL